MFMDNKMFYPDKDSLIVTPEYNSMDWVLMQYFKVDKRFNLAGNKPIVMQDTELIDKNLNPIYEADYIKDPDNNIFEVIRVKDGSWRIKEINNKDDGVFGYLILNTNCEIIGNRFENPKFINKLGKSEQITK